MDVVFLSLEIINIGWKHNNHTSVDVVFLSASSSLL